MPAFSTPSATTSSRQVWPSFTTEETIFSEPSLVAMVRTKCGRSSACERQARSDRRATRSGAEVVERQRRARPAQFSQDHAARSDRA